MFAQYKERMDELVEQRVMRHDMDAEPTPDEVGVALRGLAMTYSDDELRDIKQQFELIDTDSTGTISVEELLEATEKALPFFGAPTSPGRMSKADVLKLIKSFPKRVPYSVTYAICQSDGARLDWSGSRRTP